MRWSVMLAIGASIAMSAAGAAEPPPTGESSRPFSGSFTTREVLGIDPVGCPRTLLSGTTTGTGTVSFLGPTTGTGSDCITLTSPTRFRFSNGRLTATAANGDRLLMTYSGTLVPTRKLPVYAIAGTFAITGGTGRFASATGSGTLSGFENLRTRRGQLFMNGVVSY